MLVVLPNTYARRNITVEADQTVMSTGLYGVVRHPMYFGALIMIIGAPACARLLLGARRLRADRLRSVRRSASSTRRRRSPTSFRGYRDYTQTVHSRLVPHVW